MTFIQNRLSKSGLIHGAVWINVRLERLGDWWVCRQVRCFRNSAGKLRPAPPKPHFQHVITTPHPRNAHVQGDVWGWRLKLDGWRLNLIVEGWRLNFDSWRLKVEFDSWSWCWNYEIMVSTTTTTFHPSRQLVINLCLLRLQTVYCVPT